MVRVVLALLVLMSLLVKVQCPSCLFSCSGVSASNSDHGVQSNCTLGKDQPGSSETQTLSASCCGPKPVSVPEFDNAKVNQTQDETEVVGRKTDSSTCFLLPCRHECSYTACQGTLAALPEQRYRLCIENSVGIPTYTDQIPLPARGPPVVDRTAAVVVQPARPPAWLLAWRSVIALC